MKLSLLTLSLIAGAAFSVAAPGSKGPKGPPGPPQGTVYGVSQSCSASQSSISCCNTRINGGNKKNVYYPGGNADLTCSQIDVGKESKNQQVQDICSSTVACCIGDGCVAIAN